MSYYDPYYWTQNRRYYPYSYPYSAPIIPNYRPDDPMTQLGLTRREPAVFTSCLYCGAMYSASFKLCPICGVERGF